MPHSLNRKLLTAALALSAAVTTAAGARAWYASAEAPRMVNDAAADRDREGVEVEVVTATPHGFEPAALTRPRGPFVLAVHNQSGGAELELRLERVRGGTEREVNMRGWRRRSHLALDLPPGEYVLKDAGRPDRACRITLTR